MKQLTGLLNGTPGKPGIRTLAAVTAMVLALTIRPATADIPDRGRVQLAGMYQIAASNDLFFPMDGGQEWFLDFGKGTSEGIASGKVAVSLRENPRVSVRIMVWQYFPKEGTLLIGNQAAEGSGRAVARGAWTLGHDSGAVFLLRAKSTIVLKRADPYDY